MTNKPGIISTLETKFKAEIKQGEEALAQGRLASHWQDQITEYTGKLKNLRRLWRKLGTNPVIQQMAEVAAQKITAYHADFLIDLEALERGALESGFVWIVRNMGTHLYRLTGKPKEVEFARDATKYHFPNGIANPEQEIYICTGGALRQVKRLTDVPFKVTEPDAVEVMPQSDTLWYIFKAGQKIGTVQQIYENEKYLLYRGVNEVLVNQSYPSLKAAVAAVTD